MNKCFPNNTLYIIHKCLVLTIFILLSQPRLQAQTFTPGINFQAVARDAANNPANTRKVFVKSTIENGFPNGTVAYGDQHEVYTNEYGVFNISIGKGTHIAGVTDLLQINWAQNKYYLHLKIAIVPIAASNNWDYSKEWVDLGAVEFGVVPYALQSFSASGGSMDTTALRNKVNIADTALMLLPYKRAVLKSDSLTMVIQNVVQVFDSSRLYVTPYQLNQYRLDSAAFIRNLNLKLNIIDTASMLLNYIRQVNFLAALNLKMNITDSSNMLANYARSFQVNHLLSTKLNAVDTASLSNRINSKELLINKSIDVSNVSDYNNDNYPSVKAIKDYVDLALIAGAPDATTTNKGILLLAGDLTGTATAPLVAANSITTNKIQDAAVTDAKLATGISASKVGLANVTNHAQIYNLNGLTTQVQSLSTPGTTGLLPNWISAGSSHTLHIPMASATSVTAGLISKSDYDQFNLAYNNSINSITNMGTNGLASISNHVLNVPAYSLVGLAGNVSPNVIFAGPSSGGNGIAGFRSLVAADIPNNTANTLGNASTASRLATARYINNILFDGATDVSGLTANTPNALTFNNTGTGAASGTQFNGAIARDISYNTIGAAPSIGATTITTLGSISTGTWAANIIGANYGGAGTNNGILKANGSGFVSVAAAGTDYLAPFGSQIAKTIYAAPNGGNGLPVFRALEASDIPLLNQNTSGNAGTASSLATAVNINGVSFNGLSDITIAANTANSITFNNSGLGGSSATLFNGSAAKTISYNTIGAAPSIGSASITTLGNIVTGTWEANTIGANYGGAGSNNGILKANGVGVVSVANAGTDFQSPLTFSSPILNSANTISIPQANNTTSGYLTSTDWNTFNNKIDLSQKAALNGVASLDANGKIPTSQIPSISFSSGYVVNNQTEMLGLSAAVVGSIAIRTDNSLNYVLSSLPASTLSNWLQLLMPVSIASVNGYTQSSITLTTSDIAEGTRLYFNNTRARDAISASSPLVYTASTGVVSIPAATSSTPGYITASDWTLFNSKIGTFTAQATNSFYAGPSSGSNALPSFRNIVVEDIPTLNQNTTGNAGTATKLAATKNINGIPFDGSADITIASTISNAVTFNTSGTGLSGPVSFDGSSAKTVSYNTIGASPLVGSSSITTVGTISSGTWGGNVIDASHGGAGVTNGILKADGVGNVSAAVAGTDYLAPFTSQTSKYFYAAPNAANGLPVFRAIVASDVPTLNQATTANAGTATKLATTKTINGVPFDGSSNINIYAPVPSPLTFDDSGNGELTTATFNGAIAKTISYNTIGAAPALGSNAIVTLGSITTGTWLGSVIDANHGGSGNVNGLLKANGSGVVSAAVAGTDFENPLTFSAPLTKTSSTVSLAAATSSSNGYLTSTDWSLFNNKQATIVAGTGVSVTGGNTIAIGQAVANSSSPSFTGLTVSGLNVAGIVTNTAGGVLGTAATTGTGNIVRANTPTLITPILGDASATTLSVGAITATTINASSDVTAKRYKLTMPSNITAAATTNIDLSTGNVFTVSMGTNITTLTFTNLGVGTYLIKFVQDATGTRDVTFPLAWKWAGGVIPSLTNTANKLDIVTLIYDGNTYYATIVQNF